MACLVAQQLDAFFRGDTLTYSFTFVQENGDPLDISNNSFTFTMKGDPNSDTLAATDLTNQMTFPADANSIAGTGEMKVANTKTELVNPDTVYHYDFELIDASSEVLTMGFGTVYVKRDRTTP